MPPVRCRSSTAMSSPLALSRSEPLSFMLGAGNILRGMEKALTGACEGDEVSALLKFATRDRPERPRATRTNLQATCGWGHATPARHARGSPTRRPRERKKTRKKQKPKASQ